MELPLMRSIFYFYELTGFSDHKKQNEPHGLVSFI